MSAQIHPGAVIGRGNMIGDGARIGDGVVIGDQNEIQANVIIFGPTIIGNGNRIAAGAIIGGLSRQRFDSYHRRETPTEGASTAIGSGCMVFELVTIHRAMVRETRIEDEAAIGAHSHVAHDCIVGRGAILAVNVSLGGFSRVGRCSNLGLGVSVRPRVVIGARAMCGMSSAIVEHVPPFVTVVGVPARIVGVNHVGVTRDGLSPEIGSGIETSYLMDRVSAEPQILAEEYALFNHTQTEYGTSIAELRWPENYRRA
jgi:UDP-N-acetylglucosamine acyltransferase